MKKGFTMAEVLITIGIIGIVAAMTLPSLINKNEERVTVTKLKKFYSIINQALLYAMNDNGPVDTWIYNDIGKDDPDAAEMGKSSAALAAYIKPYLNILRDCGDGKGCIPDGYKFLNNKAYNANYNTSRRYYKIILNDGSTFFFRDNYNGTTQRTECNGEDSGLKGICGVIWFDTNGKTQSNTFGRDLFVFMILKDRIVPHPLDDCKKGGNGWGCSKYILEHDNMKYYFK